MRAVSKKSASNRAGNSRSITVFSSPRERHCGLLRCGALQLPCVLGANGITHMKREGDSATPAGRLKLLSLIVRPDRGPRSVAAVPVRAMRRSDGWCDDPASGAYNRPLRLPSSAGHETMWRDDRLYDVVGVLDWNFRPRIRRRGSAIFLHVARPDYAPTAGCIALAPRDLRLLLAAAGRNPCFLVSAKPRRLAGR